MVTRIVEEGNSVTRGGAFGWGQQLCDIIRGGATEEAGLGDHSPYLTCLDVAQQHSKVTL